MFDSSKPLKNNHCKSGGDLAVIAHRGASAYYPENTMVSFEAAIGMKADMVELDVQLSKDGEVVVFHDEKLSRCTNGRGRLAGFTLAELKRLDAGSWFDKRFQGEKIPALVDVLNLCRGRIAVNIEIKTEAVKDGIPGGIEEKCLQMIDQTGMRDDVVFSSFDPRALTHLKEIEPKAARAVLYEKKYYGSQLPSDIVALLGVAAFNCSRRELNKKWMADLSLHGIPVNVYTVNDERAMRRFAAAGVNGIFTNKPDVLRNVLGDVRLRADVRGED